MIKSDTGIQVKSPSGYYPILHTSLETNSPDYLGNGAQWVFLNGSTSWPAGFVATFEKVFNRSDCSHNEAIVKVQADDIHRSYLNGV